jgi:dihydropteroate synthase
VIHPAGLPDALTSIDRTLVMGILNVTPDSFSDGGRYLDHDAAVAHGLAMVRDGADVVDVGGESTRPGAVPVPSDEEQRRVIEVVRELATEGAYVSIDTRHADVARAAIDAGAVIVNDVSAGRGDQGMWPFIAEAEVAYVLMHNRGDGIAGTASASYPGEEWPGSMTRAVWNELDDRFEAAMAAGIRRERLIADPGIGFAKDAAMNWALATEDPHDAWATADLKAVGGPVLLGVSRKRFLATMPGGAPRVDDSMDQRDRLTVELTERAAQHGLWCVRVHDVAPNAEAVRRVRRDDWIGT